MQYLFFDTYREHRRYQLFAGEKQRLFCLTFAREEMTSNEAHEIGFVALGISERKLKSRETASNEEESPLFRSVVARNALLSWLLVSRENARR